MIPVGITTQIGSGMPDMSGRPEPILVVMPPEFRGDRQGDHKWNRNWLEPLCDPLVTTPKNTWG